MKKESRTMQEVSGLMRAINGVDCVMRKINNEEVRLLREGLDRARYQCERYINGEKLEFKPSDRNF
ncbi:hypothetical protein M6G53_20365 [Serratia nevei]|uniref:hypothetical protein n=1 Tax=Serratia nevei TaxID=2703794 RepID=UPI00209FED05|nr:hypothetical protein [Serratia nevei]MCP1107728.1 hypothetical protein [Serratia nevei]